MGVDLDHADRSQAVQRPDNRYCDGMVSPHHHGYSAPCNDLAYRFLDIPKTLLQVAVDDIGVAAIHDAPAAVQKHLIPVRIIYPVVVGKSRQLGTGPDTFRTLIGAGAVLVPIS